MKHSEELQETANKWIIPWDMFHWLFSLPKQCTASALYIVEIFVEWTNKVENLCGHFESKYLLNFLLLIYPTFSFTHKINNKYLLNLLYIYSLDFNI